MNLADRRDEASRFAAPPAGGPESGATRPSRRGRIWGSLALLLATFLAAAWWFSHQAVEYQRVQRDLDLAAGAFAAARAADTRDLAPAEWRLAAGRIDEAMAELHRQEGRFVLVRSYPTVHASLAKAIDAADAAKAAASAAREAAKANNPQGAGLESPRSWGGSGFAADKEQAKSAIDAARASLEAANEAFVSLERCPRARRAREVRKDLETVKGNLEAMKAAVATLDGQYAHEDYQNAKTGAETMKGLLDPITLDLRSIATKFKCGGRP